MDVISEIFLHVGLRKTGTSSIQGTLFSKIKEYSDRVLLLDKGKVIMIGEPKEVIEKYQSIKSSK